MMKKFLITLCCAAVSIGASAQDGKLAVNAGFLFPSTLNATIGYERPLSYGNAVELYGEAGTIGRKRISGKATIGTAASSTSTGWCATRTGCFVSASGRSSARCKNGSSSDWREGLNTAMCSVTAGSSP